LARATAEGVTFGATLGGGVAMAERATTPLVCTKASNGKAQSNFVEGTSV